MDLRGVGPATASAILAPLASSIPFMADETLEAVTHHKRDYTLRAYESMHDALHEVCRGPLEGKLNPEEAGKALWVAAMQTIHPPPTGVSSMSSIGVPHSTIQVNIAQAKAKADDNTKPAKLTSRRPQSSAAQSSAQNDTEHTTLEAEAHFSKNSRASPSTAEEGALDGRAERRSKRSKMSCS